MQVAYKIDKYKTRTLVVKKNKKRVFQRNYHAQMAGQINLWRNFHKWGSYI